MTLLNKSLRIPCLGLVKTKQIHSQVPFIQDGNLRKVRTSVARLGTECTLGATRLTLQHTPHYLAHKRSFKRHVDMHSVDLFGRKRSYSSDAIHKTPVGSKP